jgi:3-mercaptopyruvate sulfurtransferase SseA
MGYEFPFETPEGLDLSAPDLTGLSDEALTELGTRAREHAQVLVLPVSEATIYVARLASALRAAGFDDVVELEGSYEGYEKAQERTVKA